MQARHITYARIVLFCFVLLAGQLLAQTPSVTLRGLVTDPSGAVVPQATVTATTPSGETAIAVTNRQGVYELKGLMTGKYTVAVQAKGFARTEQADVALTAGQSRQLDVALEIAVEEQKVEVQDQAVNVNVDPSQNASSVIIKGKDLDALSDNPDELEADLQALAGPAAGPNGGQIYIDGFSNGQLPPKSAIREVRINQNPFSSEYDRLGYGRIEILTKPGMDQFHGQVSFSARNSIFNARNPFLISDFGDPCAPAFSSSSNSNPCDYGMHEYETDFTGPLSKKSSFSVNVERQNSDESSFSRGHNLSADSQEVVPFSFVVLNPRKRTSMSPRLDYQLTANNTLTARYQYNQSTSNNNGVNGMNLPTQAYDSSDTSQSLQISNSHILNSTTVNETRLQYNRTRNRQSAQSLQPTISVQGAFTGGGNSSGQSNDHSDRYELQNLTLITHGTHLMKFGGRLRATRIASESTANYNGRFTFASLDAYQVTELGLLAGVLPEQIPAYCPPDLLRPGATICGGARQFSIITGGPSAVISQVDAGLYAQDDWRIRSNLTLSYGLRFETQTNIGDHADFAPRVAFAWGIGRGKSTPKTVLRAGWGVFYDRFSENNVMQAERLNGVTQRQIVIKNPNFFSNDIAAQDALAAALAAAQSNGTVYQPTIYQIDPKLRAPYMMQTAISIERQLTKVTSLSMNYINSRGVHTLVTQNINAPERESGIRPFGDIGNIYQYRTEGIFRQNQFMTNINVRGARLSLFANYTLNFADSTGSFPADPYNLLGDYGRAPFDIRHRVHLFGNLSLPYGFRLNPMIIASSGPPFNITVGEDLNGDGQFNDRPAFATNLSLSSVYPPTPWGRFDTAPSAGQTIIPINYGTGPGSLTVNLRVAKTFGIGKKKKSEVAGVTGRGGEHDHGPHGGPGGGPGHGGFGGHGPGGGPWGGVGPSNARYNLTFSASARNLFNHVNAAPPIGTLDPVVFGKSTQLAGYFGGGSSAANRRIELRAQFSF